MKLGKITNGAIDLIEVENGEEITREKTKRTEAELYSDGYKKACPSEDGTGEWSEYPTCLVQISAPHEDLDQEGINY